jgi:hypothetical protein
MTLRRQYARSIVAAACLGVAVMGGALVGTYSIAGMNPIYTQSRDHSVVADDAESGDDLFGARPAAYSVADPADAPRSFFPGPSLPRDIPAADTPGA